MTNDLDIANGLFAKAEALIPEIPGQSLNEILFKQHLMKGLERLSKAVEKLEEELDQRGA